MLETNLAESMNNGSIIKTKIDEDSAPVFKLPFWCLHSGLGSRLEPAQCTERTLRVGAALMLCVASTTRGHVTTDRYINDAAIGHTWETKGQGTTGGKLQQYNSKFLPNISCLVRIVEATSCLRGLF